MNRGAHRGLLRTGCAPRMTTSSTTVTTAAATITTTTETTHRRLDIERKTIKRNLEEGK